MPTKNALPYIVAAVVAIVAIGAVFVFGAKAETNGDAHVSQAPATEVAETTDTPTTTTTAGSDCGLLDELTIDVSEAPTSTAPGGPSLGFTFHRGDEVPCLDMVDECWVEVQVPEWARDNYDPGTRQYLHLGVTKSKKADPGGPCFTPEPY